jgi:hypothetical protein
MNHLESIRRKEKKVESNNKRLKMLSHGRYGYSPDHPHFLEVTK